jgi:hypothetical protein
VSALRRRLAVGAAADRKARAAALADLRAVEAPSSEDLRAVCGIAKGRLPKPRTLAARLAAGVEAGLAADALYPALSVRCGACESCVESTPAEMYQCTDPQRSHAGKAAVA